MSLLQSLLGLRPLLVPLSRNSVSSHLSRGFAFRSKFPWVTRPVVSRLTESYQCQVTQVRYSVSFLKKLTAEQLWKGVTSVSNAGKNRGRGKGVGKRMAKDLNRGQHIGVGKVNMVWPGLNAAIIRGKEVVKQQQLPKDEEREARLIKIRDSMGVFRPLHLHPLERGWCGTKYPGRSIGPPDPIAEDNFEDFDTKVLELKTVTNMSGRLGRVRRISVFVMTGNKNGAIGFALAKASNLRSSLRKVRNRAGQNLIYIDRYNDRTIYHDFFSQFVKSKIFVKKMPEGYGLRCHRAIKEICQLAGITDVHAKIEGSTNVQNVTKAFVLGLLQQKNHKALADEKKLLVVRTREGDYPRVLATPELSTVRMTKEIPMDEELDYTRVAMGGKVVLERKKNEPFYTKLPGWETYLKKELKRRNHEKIRQQLLLEYGEVRSFYTEKYPECLPNAPPYEED